MTHNKDHIEHTKRTVENGRPKHIHDLIPVDAVCLRKREPFRHDINGSTDEKVAGEFNDIRSAGIVTKAKDSLARSGREEHSLSHIEGVNIS